MFMWPAFCRFSNAPSSNAANVYALRTIFIQLNSTAQIYYLIPSLLFFSLFSSLHSVWSYFNSYRLTEINTQKSNSQNKNLSNNLKKKKKKTKSEHTEIDVHKKEIVPRHTLMTLIKFKNQVNVCLYVRICFLLLLASKRLPFFIVRMCMRRFQMDLFPIYLFGSCYWSSEWKKEIQTATSKHL